MFRQRWKFDMQSFRDRRNAVIVRPERSHLPRLVRQRVGMGDCGQALAEPPNYEEIPTSKRPARRHFTGRIRFILNGFDYITRNFRVIPRTSK